MEYQVLRRGSFTQYSNTLTTTADKNGGNQTQSNGNMNSTYTDKLADTRAAPEKALDS